MKSVWKQLVFGGVLMFAAACGSSDDDAKVGKYMSGEIHNHTGQSNDVQTKTITLENLMGVAFRNEDIIGADPDAYNGNIKYGAAFDYLIFADHLRSTYNGLDSDAGNGSPKNDTPLYISLKTQFEAIKQIQASNELYKDKIVYSGFEWDMPKLDHAAVGMIDSNSDEIPYEGIHEFEWLYARKSEEKFGPDIWNGGAAEQQKYGDRKQIGLETLDTTYEVLQWLEDNYPESYLQINHPSRHGNGAEDDGIELQIEYIRRMHDTAPNIVIGMEGLVGNMLGDGYGELPKHLIRSRADQMIAITGGVWDSLLAEGRRIHNFANSDFHFKINNGAYNGSGYWPGEYSRNYTFVTPGEDGITNFRDIAAGMRSGNSYAVLGELISDLDFTLSANGESVTMGDYLLASANSEVTVTIRFKIPANNNYESLHGNYNDYTDAVSNVPSLDHIDLISGTVTGKVDKGDYDKIQSDASIIEVFTAADWGTPDDDGFYTLSFKTTADSDRFFRIRGLSSADVDGNGDPVTDERNTSYGNRQEANDNYNDFNYTHLSFYANPIWLTLE